MTTGRAHVVEELVAPEGQQHRYYLSTKAPWYGPEGEVIGLIGIARDIHELKDREAQLRAADEQKALLLRDINHRVKNSLMSVSGLLHLNRRKVQDPAAVSALDGAAQQLFVLGRVFDRLHYKDSATVCQHSRVHRRPVRRPQAERDRQSSRAARGGRKRRSQHG